MSNNKAAEEARPFTMGGIDWAGVTESWEGLLWGVSIGNILAGDANAVPNGPQERPASVPVKKKKKNRSSEAEVPAKLPKYLHPASHEPLRAPAEPRRNSAWLPTVPKVDQVSAYWAEYGAQQNAHRSTSQDVDEGAIPNAGGEVRRAALVVG